jgi:hypothetical protein
MLSMERLLFRFRYGIDSPLVPGVAAGETLDCQPETSGGAVSLHCLNGIGGTTRVETTVLSDKRTEDHLVGSDQNED